MTIPNKKVGCRFQTEDLSVPNRIQFYINLFYGYKRYYLQIFDYFVYLKVNFICILYEIRRTCLYINSTYKLTVNNYYNVIRKCNIKFLF